jgi:hypothetical protein
MTKRANPRLAPVALYVYTATSVVEVILGIVVLRTGSKPWSLVLMFTSLVSLISLFTYWYLQRLVKTQSTPTLPAK